MHRTALILLASLVFAAGCTSSSGGGVSGSRTYMQSQPSVFTAVEVALIDAGARIVHSNTGSGTITATLNVDALGSRLTIDVRVPRWMDGAEVSLHLNDPAGTDDARREAELERIRDDIFAAIDDALRGMRGAPRGRP